MFDELFTGLTIRPVTQGLVTRLLLDLPLTPAALVDFGVDSATHYRALKAVLSSEEEGDLPVSDEEDETLDTRATETLRQRIVELDAAIGNGILLNALVKKYAPAYADRVKFCTSMDVITDRAEPTEQ